MPDLSPDQFNYPASAQDEGGGWDSPNPLYHEDAEILFEDAWQEAPDGGDEPRHVEDRRVSVESVVSMQRDINKRAVEALSRVDKFDHRPQVFTAGDRNVLVEGNHRLNAVRHRGDSEVDVAVVDWEFD